MALERPETWEAQTDSTIFLYVHDRRTQQYRLDSVGGKGKRRIRLTTEDREYNQNMIPEENRALDPFLNGRLACIDGGQHDTVTEADLTAIVAVQDPEEFAALVKEAVDSELTAWRLMSLTERDGRMWQVDIVRERCVALTPHSNKSQKTVLEMMQRPSGDLSEESVITG